MKMLRITLEGKSYEVGVEVLDGGTSAAPVRQMMPATAPSVTAPPTSTALAPSPPLAAGCREVVCPMAGLVFKCLVKPGDVVAPNQVVMVLDAMKMETPVASPFSGTVKTVLVKVGDAVDEGRALLQIEG